MINGHLMVEMIKRANQRLQIPHLADSAFDDSSVNSTTQVYLMVDVV
jgi:hypothetical protein